MLGELMKGYEKPEDLLGEKGLLEDLTKRRCKGNSPTTWGTPSDRPPARTPAIHKGNPEDLEEANHLKYQRVDMVGTRGLIFGPNLRFSATKSY